MRVSNSNWNLKDVRVNQALKGQKNIPHRGINNSGSDYDLYEGIIGKLCKEKHKCDRVTEKFGEVENG